MSTRSPRYDKTGNETGRTLPSGQSESKVYDQGGKLIQSTDFNGGTTHYHYHEQTDRLIKIEYADGSSEQFDYDVIGNRTQAVQIDPQNNERITRWEYDVQDRVVKEIQPDGSTLEYRYDANGNRTRVTLTPAGQALMVTDYAYDPLNRLATVTDSTGVTTYAYDNVGNRTRVDYPSGTSQVYQYDTANRLIQRDKVRQIEGASFEYKMTSRPTTADFIFRTPSGFSPSILPSGKNNHLLIEKINELCDAFRYVKQQKPFRINAIVVLPDHLHCI